MISLEHAREIRSAMEAAASNLDDATALTAVEMFPKWIPRGYSTGERVRHMGILYRCLQSHQANETWNPADAPSLWARVLIPDPSDIPEWVQPDSTNPYMKGDKVKHNGKIWISDIDYNVFEPGVAMWTEVTE